MPKTSTPKRFISVRLSEDEYAAVQRNVERSTCGSLTEYVKKVLINKPVTIKTRNESQDLLLQEIVRVKNRLNELIDHPESIRNATLLGEIKEIKSIIQQIAKKWLA